ncbi:AfsR/SARP family transcriptional regulator [Nocardia goodfellowii]|uniref:DNA-binding SARP family transcriptional activator n=1 Tax=Nocardia goodfellowii TaxID=882446 RepID=A0ABS4Q878_9NOCA|nr:AfsR/SARP family transcriptional regulator [Nocardia goodfellowii]MBP2187900.1 DNA-binding SARP family transcriptional activator [Nocardia goodfellowii]
MTQRAVLGYLLLNANQVVPTSRLQEVLWQGEPPSTARKIIQNSVWAIRRLIADHADEKVALTTRAPGYLFWLSPESLDLHRFRQLALQGRLAIGTRNFEDGIELLRKALALWAGNALEDLGESHTRWSELVAIEDERMAVYEDCFDAALACGRHRELTPELEVLTNAEPLRENLCRQYMLALYRSGRQVDALNVFRRTRDALVHTVGIEPGHELQHLHRLILRQDPMLLGQLDGDSTGWMRR